MLKWWGCCYRFSWSFYHYTVIFFSKSSQVGITLCLRYCIFDSFLYFVENSTRIRWSLASHLVGLMQTGSWMPIFKIIIFVLFLIFNWHLGWLSFLFWYVSRYNSLVLFDHTPVCLTKIMGNISFNWCMTKIVWKISLCSAYLWDTSFTFFTPYTFLTFFSLIYTDLWCWPCRMCCLTIWSFFSCFISVFCFLWRLRCFPLSYVMWRFV